MTDEVFEKSKRLAIIDGWTFTCHDNHTRLLKEDSMSHVDFNGTGSANYPLSIAKMLVKYNSSWDWLIPVWFKINGQMNNIGRKDPTMRGVFGKYRLSFASHCAMNKIEDAFNLSLLALDAVDSFKEKQNKGYE